MKKDRLRYEFMTPKRRAELNNAPECHDDDFSLKLIQQFVNSVYAGEKPDDWVLTALADAFSKVIEGGRWEDELPLPWTKTLLPWSAAEWRDIGIFCDVSNIIRTDPKFPVTEAISNVAELRNVSYETARHAYYSHKGLIEKDLKTDAQE